MFSAHRIAFATALCFLLLTPLFADDCAVGEVCLEAVESDQTNLENDKSAVESLSQAPADVARLDEVTTETFTAEQRALVDQITRNLKRRRLTRPAGDNALVQIQQLQAIHPLHDYSVNGHRYLSRIFMVLGRSALRNGDPVLAEQRLQNAVRFDPRVARQQELKAGIAKARSSTDTASTDVAAAESVASDPVSEQRSLEVAEPTVDQTGNSETVIPAIKVTTETFNSEQAELVDGITRNLKQRSLTEPAGDNALEKIQLLKELHPAHDYSVNGTKYIARISIRLARRALQQGDLELASRHMLKAIRFDPNVEQQDELKSAIASAARQRETQREIQRETQRDQRETERETERGSQQQASRLADDSAPVTSYLDSNRTEPQPQTEAIEFVAPVMVAIPAGSFLMGSDQGAADETPVHSVALEAFSMSKHEITMQQYRVFALATGRPAPQYLAEHGNLPVTNVSWHDAVAYTQWLSKRTQRQFRLPTESEWEYAARAGTTDAYFTGETLINAGNCVGCGGQWDGKSVAPVGSFTPNDFGLFDTHGNVWEWVQDCWTSNYKNRDNSPAAVELPGCDRRVLRGGSWYNSADFARVSFRGNEMDFFRDRGVGFRVVYEGL